MHCLTWRTKSPPVISSSSSTSASSSPAAQSCAYGVNPGSGRRVSGRPASSSLALRSWAMRSTARDRVATAFVGHRAGGSGPAPSRTAPLVREARHHRGELGRVEAVEEPFTQRLGDDQVGLGVEAGEHARPHSVSDQSST